MKEHILEEIKDLIMEEMEGPFEVLDNLIKPVSSAYDLFADTIKNVKEAWTLLKKG